MLVKCENLIFAHTFRWTYGDVLSLSLNCPLQDLRYVDLAVRFLELFYIEI